MNENRTDYGTDDDALLARPYLPCAIHYQDCDSLEYVTRDVACIYENIDGDLAIVRDMETRKIIGFRLSRFSRLKR